MKEKNPLLCLFGGIALLAAGLYWLTQSVVVSSGFGMGRFMLGGMSIPSGLIVVPLLLGIFWAVLKPGSFGAKIVIVAGVVIIVAAIIASVELHFVRKSLYEYILMLGMIFVGAALLARVLLTGNGKDDKDNKK